MHIDIETYKARSGRVSLDGIDFGAFRSQPLDERSLRCLRYMHDVEHHTICYLRDLLATLGPQRSRGDHVPHHVVVRGVLARRGARPRCWPSTTSRRAATRVAALRRSLRWTDRFAPTLHGLGSLLAGASYTAVHMTWGAVNEWTTQAGYGRLRPARRPSGADRPPPPDHAPGGPPHRLLRHAGVPAARRAIVGPSA